MPDWLVGSGCRGVAVVLAVCASTGAGSAAAQTRVSGPRQPQGVDVDEVTDRLAEQPWVQAIRRSHPGALDPIQLPGAPQVYRPEAVPGGAAADEGWEPAGSALDLSAVAGRLPASLGDLSRVQAGSADADWTEGMIAAQALVHYASEDRARRVTIALVDIESDLPPSVRAGIRALRETSFDRRTESGYERTREVQGRPAVERWRAATQQGALSVLATDRIGVTLQGERVSMAALEAAATRIVLPAVQAAGF